MDIHPKISIIVPVYNVEKYLHRCIDSILAQTFTDFELLLVDDGSEDHSGAICDEHAVKDNRIRVFHKENGGVSSARNVGLDNANGEWIAFVDGDDCITKDYLMLDETDGVDVIQKSYIVKNVRGNDTFYGVKDGEINDKDSLYKFYVQKRENALWNKIISSKLINGKRFDENVSIGEDFLFFLSLLCDIHSYRFCTKGAYVYYIRDNSAMHSLSQDKLISILFRNINNVKDITNRYGIIDVGNCIIASTYVNSLWKFRHALVNEQKCLFKRIFEKLSIEKLQYVSSYEKILFAVKKSIYLLFY